MNDGEPPLEKKNNQPTSKPSLPDDLLLSCFARVSILYYPTLSFVSKRFRSLLASPELYKARSLLNRTDSCLHVCLQFPSYANWAEVFDTKTQNWELLPDPGLKTRFSSIRIIEVIDRKIYIRRNKKKDYVFDLKEGKWDIAPKTFFTCVIEDVWYSFHKQRCSWYDTRRQEWRVVRALECLNSLLRYGMIEIANYGGKLLILWDEFEHHRGQYKDIWCAVIAFEKYNNGDEVWGSIEWANVVGKVPSSYVFVRSLVSPV